MKIAIVHDELVRRGGAEQVVLSLHKAFPEAPIYTLCYNPEKTFAEFKALHIISSWFQRIGNTEKLVKLLYFPFAILAMRSIKLKDFDVVIISTTHCAKFIRVSKGTKVITYCHTPFRLAWRPFSYSMILKSGRIMKWAFLKAIKLLKYLDIFASHCTDWFITNSKEVMFRIINAYHPDNKIAIINPPVNNQNFYMSDYIKDYFLVVCRLEAYKKVDLVINAFNEMPDKKLIIVGKGSMEAELKKMAGDNILFLNSMSTKELGKLYAECQAFIFPQHEDYGITPLEAAASGRPVIAYGRGGVLDTMIPYTFGNEKKSTAIFFEQQTVESLIDAIHEFETLEFNPFFIKSHSERFNENIFINKIKEFVFNKMKPIRINYPIKNKAAAIA